MEFHVQLETMTIGTIFAGLALLILVGLILARPFLMSSGQRPRNGQARGPRQVLLAQKEALLRQVRELDFEHETGKLPDEVYQPQRAQLIAETTAVLQQLDDLADGELETPSEAPVPDVEAEIEAAVARLRQTRAKTTTAKATVTKAAGTTNGKGGFCPQCGQPVDRGDKFCATCGHKLHARQPA
jgi:hypothetical protein